MKQGTSDSTIVTTDDPRRLSPVESSIMDWCNLAHEARGRGDLAVLAECERELTALLRRYDETDGDGHANPAWARPNQRALIFSALGRIENAVAAELIALRYADTPRRREVSLGNIADRLVRLDRADEAVPYFLDAWENAPLSIPVILTGARAFHALGRLSEADALFASLLDSDDLLSGNADLGAYLRYEEGLREMAFDLPSLAALFARFEPREGDRS